MKKTLLVMSVIVLIVFVGFAATPIKIGVVGPFEQEAGTWIRYGALYATEAINEAGGILGRPIELLFEDDGVSAENSNLQSQS